MGAKKLLSPECGEEIGKLAGYGLTDKQIAYVKNVSEKTIQNNFREDLNRGRAVAASRVMETAYEMAVSGKNANMTRFWLMARCGWRETIVNENSDLTKDKTQHVKLEIGTQDPIEASKVYQKFMAGS